MTAYKWLPVMSWKDVPIGSIIAISTESGKPSNSWYNSSIKVRLSRIETGKIFYSINGEDNENYSYVAIHSRYLYLQEYEPYDPNQEPEDDCTIGNHLTNLP